MCGTTANLAICLVNTRNHIVTLEACVGGLSRRDWGAVWGRDDHMTCGVAGRRSSLLSARAQRRCGSLSCAHAQNMRTRHTGTHTGPSADLCIEKLPRRMNERSLRLTSTGGREGVERRGPTRHRPTSGLDQRSVLPVVAQLGQTAQRATAQTAAAAISSPGSQCRDRYPRTSSWSWRAP